MSDFYDASFASGRDHMFLGIGHEKNERKTQAVIILCVLIATVKTIDSSVFGSLALVADGLRMSTHTGAMLIAAPTYTYVRRYTHDPHFMLGTGKLGDLAGYTSTIILAMTTLLTGHEAVARFLSSVPIHFAGVTPIVIAGLPVNITNVWLLSDDDHHGHSHDHSHDHHHGAAYDDVHGHGEDVQHITTPAGVLALSVFEDDMPPVLRPAAETVALPNDVAMVATIRPDGVRQEFIPARKSDVLKSITDIPEPHALTVVLKLGGQGYTVVPEEHGHGYGREGHHRDHNMYAAYVHVLANVPVSVLAIVSLLLARTPDWLQMDPLAGVVDTLVITSWSYGLLRDTGGILVDMTSGKHIADCIKIVLEADGDTLLDLHVWRIGPGHLSAVVSMGTRQVRRGS